MEKVRVYPYRWVVLIIFMIANAMIQVHWVNFAPITNEAAKFYGVSQMKIGLFSLCYMFVFIVMCVPASYIIERWGLKTGVGIGVALTAVFGALKGICGTSYTIVLISQFGLAVAQPFIMNAVTMVAAKWFPLHERATAAGFAALSQYLGIIVTMVLSPVLFEMYSMQGMLRVYAVASVATAAVFFIFMRESPPTPPSTIQEIHSSKFFTGIRNLFAKKDMILLLIAFFFGLGMFNAVTTWIEPILAPRGLSSAQAGIVGAAMMGGGVLGAIILPILSDVMSKRKLFIALTLMGTIPGLIGITFACSYMVILIAAGILGFFIMAAGPIGFQYGAEISYPTPEATSQGIILLVGQVSGIIFVFAMDFFKSSNGAMTPFMIAFIVFMIISAILASCLKESALIKIDDTK